MLSGNHLQLARLGVALSGGSYDYSRPVSGLVGQQGVL